MGKEKITVVSGIPTFHREKNPLLLNITEGPKPPPDICLTRLRPQEGSNIPELCRRAWERRDSMILQYVDVFLQVKEIPVVAVHVEQQKEQELLKVWVLMYAA